MNENTMKRVMKAPLSAAGTRTASIEDIWQEASVPDETSEWTIRLPFLKYLTPDSTNPTFTKPAAFAAPLCFTGETAADAKALFRAGEIRQPESGTDAAADLHFAYVLVQDIGGAEGHHWVPVDAKGQRLADAEHTPYTLADDAVWQTEVPKANGEAGKDITYTVFWRIQGGRNDDADAARDTNYYVTAGQYLAVSIYRQATTLTLHDLDTDNDEAVLVQRRSSTGYAATLDPVYDVHKEVIPDTYGVKAGDLFELYTNKSLRTGGVVSSIYTQGAEYAGEHYAYKYIIEIPAVIPQSEDFDGYAA